LDTDVCKFESSQKDQNPIGLFIERIQKIRLLIEIYNSNKKYCYVFQEKKFNFLI